IALRYSGCGLALARRGRYAACRRNRQREEVAPVQTHPEFPNLFLLDHPLIQHKLTLLRCADTPTGLFRELLKEKALLMGRSEEHTSELQSLMGNSLTIL